MGTRPMEGQVSLVTGAGRGIGRATAMALAEAGSAVVLGSRSLHELEQVASEVKERGSEALVTRLDVTDDASVRGFVDAAVERFGRIDVLVNNAGSNNGGENGAIGPLWEINPEAWWHDVTVNLRGTFLCTHAVLPYMVKQGSGHIINLSSMGPATRAWPYNSAYASSKAAQVRLTDSLAEELRETGVSVFALSPGRVRTQLSDEALDTPAGRKWLMPLFKAQGNTEVTVEVPANAVVFLASGEADGLSGRLLRAEWDLRDLASRASEIVERDGLALRLTAAT